MASPASVGKHPIHPMLIPFPIALWIFSLICDLIYVMGLGRHRVEGDGILYDGRESSALSLPPSPDTSITGRLPFLPSRKSAGGIWGLTSPLWCCSRSICGYGWEVSLAPLCLSYCPSSVSPC